MSLYKCVQNFLQNIRDSFRFSLRELHKRTQRLDKPRLDEDLLIETILYEIPNSKIKRPTIKTADETINELITTNKSIARFGDGEIILADGKDIPFQRAEKELTRRLQEIMAKPQENLLVAVNRRYYYPNIFEAVIKQTNPIYKRFELYGVPSLRRQLDKYLNKEMLLYEAGITGNTKFFSLYRNFFQNKKLVLVGCKEALKSYEFNIFDKALKLDYEFVPNKHCFSVYNETLDKLCSYDKDSIMILMCGPTACVLAADLTKNGFKALDLGHLAKSYDWHKRGIDMNANEGQNAVKFFAPDE